MTDLARRIEDSRWAVVIPMAVAAVLGLVTIGSKSMWLDEAFSASIIQLPTSDLAVFLFRNEQQASPYYLVLQAWSVFGYSETALRLLSVVIGVIAVAATYALGRRFGVGLWAALLLAVAPYFVHYEQEVRVYTLLVAWSAITTLAYLRLVERPNRWRGAAYVIAAALLIYIHPLSAWVLVAHAAATLLFAPPEWRRRLLALYLPVAIAAIPMVRFLAINRGKAFWIPAVTPYGFVHSLSQLMGAAALAVALTLIVVAGLSRAWRRELRPPGVALPGLTLPGMWLPLLVGGFTVGGILLLSFTVQPLFVERYLIGVLPVLFIVVAMALKALPWPRVALAGLLALSLASTVSWYMTGIKDDWRSAVAYVQAQAQPMDGVVFWPNYSRMAFAYYGQAGQPIFPGVPWSTLYLPNLGISNYIPPDVPNERIWLVRDTAFNLSPELTVLLDHYQTVTTIQFGHTVPQVELLVRR